MNILSLSPSASCFPSNIRSAVYFPKTRFDNSNFTTKLTFGIVTIPSRFLGETGKAMSNHFMSYTTVTNKTNARREMLDYRLVRRVCIHDFVKNSHV